MLTGDGTISKKDTTLNKIISGLQASLTSEMPSETDMFGVDILQATGGNMLEEVSTREIKVQGFTGNDILTALVWPSG